MPSHLYVVVTCKTKGCKNICALKYLGPDIGAIEIGEMAPTGVQCECGQCHREYRYELAEFRVEQFPLPPPAGWVNGWEP